MAQSKEKINYKLVSIILAGLLVLTIIIGVMTYQKEQMRTQGIIEGQENAVNLILESVEEDGEVQIDTPQGNVTLIRSEAANIAQQNLVEYIFSQIQREGSVTLQVNNTQLTLVPQ